MVCPSRINWFANLSTSIFINGSQLGFGRFQDVSIFNNLSGSDKPVLVKILINLVAYLNPITWLSGKMTCSFLDIAAVIVGLPFFFLLKPQSLILKHPKRLMGLLLFFSIIPTILTHDNPNLLRAVPLQSVLYLVGAWGLYLFFKPIFNKSKKIILRAPFILAAVALAAYGILIFWSPDYTLGFTYFTPFVGFGFEYPNLVHLLENKYANEKVIYVDRQTQNQIQIFFIMFKPWEPKALQNDQQFVYNDKGWYYTTRLGRYYFCENPACEKLSPSNLQVKPLTSKPKNVKILDFLPVKSKKYSEIGWYIFRNN
jgi:hypothetical protein